MVVRLGTYDSNSELNFIALLPFNLESANWWNELLIFRSKEMIALVVPFGSAAVLYVWQDALVGNYALHGALLMQCCTYFEILTVTRNGVLNTVLLIFL